MTTPAHTTYVVIYGNRYSGSMPKGIPLNPRTVEDRFWSKVDRLGPDECWEWQRYRNPDGYGIFWHAPSGSMVMAHRMAYALARGGLANIKKPERGAAGVLVLHSCDNPPCVNPRHLSLGDNARNMQEAVERKRRRHLGGAANPNARLTPTQVDAIRSSYTGKHGDAMRISREYGISSGHVSKILKGHSW
jgi:hypothetical protein